MGQAPSQEDINMTPSSASPQDAKASSSTQPDPKFMGKAASPPVSPMPSEESFGNIVPTTFTWAFGGNSVFVTGSWDNWHEKIAMTRTPTGYTTVISIPVGTYQYKFIVDGNWRHAPAADVQRDEHGNLNNVIVVRPHEPEYDSNDPPGGIERPPSPIESYDYSMPPHDDYSVEPPMRPPLFNTAPLSEPSTEDSTRSIRNVCLNHLFIPRDTPPNPEVRTLATVERFKEDKFITTIMVTRASSAGRVAKGFRKMQSGELHRDNQQGDQ